MITIELALFAKFSSRYPVPGSGRSARAFSVPPGTNLAQLVREIGLEGEQRISFVNGRHAADDQLLAEGDRVALFPPIAGG